jgi:hypothetical protein
MDLDDDITIINDIREPAVFRTTTFSNFKKTDVKKELLSCLVTGGKVERACFWAAELICAGHYSDLWEIILAYLGKYIHIGNPKLPIYLEMRYQCYQSIVSSSMFAHPIHARNSATLRKLFAEVICVLCFSNKKHSFDYIKIDRTEEFDIENITEKLRAPSMTYIEDIFRREDPAECTIPCNEFAFSIESGDTIMACYWIEWMVEFDIQCKKNKDTVYADRRTHIPVSYKHQQDVIWIFWDIIQYAVEKKENITSTIRELMERIIGAILQLFCVHYTPGCSRRRRYLLYYAITLLTENVDFHGVEMITNKAMIETILSNIDNVYVMMKENEETPGTDYLFTGMEKKNTIERSMRRMEILGRADGP